MMYLAAIAMAPALAATPPPDAPAGFNTAELSVLTYNVRGLPWPPALGCAQALKGIGAELAAMRREGRHPSLSDHDGYLVRYRLSWTPPTTHAARAPIQVRPRLGVWGLKVSVKY